MADGYLKIAIQTFTEKIDRLGGEIFVKDLEIKKLKEENERLQKTVKLLEKALAQEVAEDGKL